MWNIEISDTNGNSESIQIDFRPWEKMGMTEAEYIHREAMMFCDCDQPDSNPLFVEKLNIPDVGMINKHGFACRNCGKYVQIG